MGDNEKCAIENLSEDTRPIEFVKDGKMHRRTFIKGVGWITVASALGLGAAGCAPAEKAADNLAETGAGTDEAAEKLAATEYSYACCSYNCTSRCQIGRAHV